ncbi:MAG: SLBB domain-containing protein [Ardenticatenaceae bacterium]|nr:SLBB domain-containing protein [Ardenticatenaceae bacterium]MCB8947074.1 SLBB domain-containing protein [Ardenticatenaceae bacterium]
MEKTADIVEAVKRAGITGAGGAGFPTHVKLQAQAEYLLANGAECEPLTHVDKQLMLHHAAEVVEGMRLGMQATGAKQGIFGIKGKYKEVIASIQSAIKPGDNITVSELGNFYPAGDEQVMVYDILGRIVPEGGLPINVGCVVQNIETLYNISAAAQGKPFTHKYLTVIGAVAKPMSVRVPIGITIQEVLDLAGGVLTPDPVILDGGAMMGAVVTDFSQPITKRSKMLLVLPYDHQLSVKRRTPRVVIDNHAIAACDQCYFCTDYCPRHAQGHAIEPHKLILLLASGVPLTDAQMAGAMLCCECRTCNYACPVHLAPGDIALNIKRDLVKAGMKNPYHRQTEASPYRDYRRVPMTRLISRLGLVKYDVPAPLTAVSQTFTRVTLKLSQHIGAPAQPVVKVGDKVSLGDMIGKIPAGALGVPLHASIDGVVREVTNEAIVIEAN